MEYPMEVSASGGLTRSMHEDEDPAPSKTEFFGLYSELAKLKRRAGEYARRRGWPVPSTPAPTPAPAGARMRDPPSVERLAVPRGIIPVSKEPCQFPMDQPEKVVLTGKQLQEYQEYIRSRDGHSGGDSRQGGGKMGGAGQRSGRQDRRAGAGGSGRGGVWGRLGSRSGGKASSVDVGGKASLVEVEARKKVWQESKDTITNFINQGWKERVWTEDEKEQMRILGGACSRCRGSHKTWKCPYKKSELVCSYPPCSKKRGHTIGVCHDLMKRCNVEMCHDQRGHRSKCHSFIEGGEPYGFGPDAVKALKSTFEDHKYLLTTQEHEAIARYEEKKKREEEEEKEAEEEERKGLADAGVGASGGGPMRRGREERGTPYGKDDSRWSTGKWNI